MKPRSKQSVITFKTDAGLARILDRIPNRSEFIRAAVLSALDSACPLCAGTGILSVDQRRHWQSFQEHHRIERCGACQAVHVVCDAATQTVGGRVQEDPR